MEKLKNKIFPIICILMFFIFLFSSKTYAVYDDILERNSIYNKIITTVRTHWAGDEGGRTLFKKDDGSFVSFCYPGNSNIYFDNNNNLNISCSGNIAYVQYCLYYFDSEGNYVTESLSSLLSGNTKTFEEYKTDNYLYSDKEIFDSNGNIVNPYPPVLFQVEEVVQIPEIMNRALQVIIPIGLVVLSIGLLIYVVKSVILRKI